MTVVFDSKLCIVDIINPDISMLLDLTKDVLVGKHADELKDITAAGNRYAAQIISYNVNKAFKENRNVYFEYPTRSKDGIKAYTICYGKISKDDRLYIDAITIDESDIFEAHTVFTNYIINPTIDNVQMDVTRRKDNEVELERQFALLTSMYENLPVGILIYDKNGDFISLNKKIETIFGITQQTTLVTNLFNDRHISPDKREEIKTGKDIDYEISYKKENGDEESLFLSIKVTIIRDRLGVIHNYLLICEDITERKNAERELRQKHSLIESIYNSVPVGIELYDRKGSLIEVNNYDMEMMGIESKKSVLGINLFGDPNTPDEIKQKTQSGINVEYTLDYDFNLVKNGYYNTVKSGRRFMHVKTAILRDPDNEIDGYLVSYQDKTKDIIRERLLEEAGRKFSAMFSSMTNGIELYDKSGVLIDCNDADLNIFGIENKRDFINGRVSLFDNPNIPYTKIERQLKDSTHCCEIKYDFDIVREKKYYKTRKSGSIYIDMKFSPIYINEDEFFGYIAEMKDISDVKEKEKQLQETKTHLEMALNSSDISVWNFETDTRCFKALYGNPIAGNGISWDKFMSLLHPDDVGYVNDVFSEIISEKSEKNIFVIRIKNEDIEGGYSFYESSLIGIKSDGIITHITGTEKNITYNVLIKKHLEESNIKTNLILDNLTSGFVHIDNNYNVVWENLSRINSTYQTGRYKVGRKCYETVNGLISPCEKCVVKEIKKSGRRTTITQYDNNGTVMEITGDVVKNKDGKLVGYLCRFDDMTEISRQRNELEKEREELNLAFEAGNISAWTYNIEEKMFNTLQGETISGTGLTMEDNLKILHPDDRKMQSELFESLEKGIKQSASAIFRYIDKDGSYRYYESMMRSRAVKGKISVITGTQKDITSDISNKKELIRLKEKAISANIILNQILDNTPCLLYVKNASDNFKFILVNDRFCKYVNRRYEDIIGHKESEMFDKENCEKFYYYDKLTAETNEMLSYDECIVMNGESSCWRTTKSPIKMNNGDVYIIGTATDITETLQSNKKLKIAQKEVILANEILNEVIDRVPGVFYIKDASTFKYIKANQAFCRITGKKQNIVVGHNDFDFFDKQSADIYRSYDLRLKNGEKMISYSNKTIIDGKTAYWLVTKSIITTPDHRQVILCTATDVTKLHEINIELEDAKTKAEQADKLKSAFLANMSHEIRTPLNAIVGFSNLLQETDDPYEKSEYLNIINTNNELLLRLIEDILDLSKIESGFIELKPETFDMVSIFNETYVSLINRCTNSKVALKIINPYKECIVTLDRNRIVQVITNFATNSIKYTEKGEITIGYEYVDGGIRIYVKDTGIGIKSEKQQFVFRRFAKLNDFGQGTGLGLAISKAIIEANNGKIGFESQENKGSTFWAWIPCKAQLKEKNEENDN